MVAARQAVAADTKLRGPIDSW